MDLLAMLAYFLLIFNLVSSQETNSNTNENSAIHFRLKLVDVDWKQAVFEIIDDNKTTINYLINYEGTGESVIDSTPTTINIRPEHLIQLQTNSLTLTQIEEKMFNNDTNNNNTWSEVEDLADKIENEGDKIKDLENSSGEIYKHEQINNLKNKPYKYFHRFSIQNLDPNTFYRINFTIRARMANLNSQLLLISTSHTQNRTESLFQKQKESILRLNFTFKTMYDYEHAAIEACQASKTDPINSCYMENTNCKQCKPNCYEVKTQNNMSNFTLCEVCPCDTSRSTGKCVLVDLDNREDNQFLPKQKPKCKECIFPYSGDLCNECMNDGIDYYKDYNGKCLKCNCNGNSIFDSSSSSQRKNRKCAAVTGQCIECLYNTAGTHCHECKEGFHGDAIKRTCKPKVVKNESLDSDIYDDGPNFNKKKNSDYLNKKYSYRSLALFTLYIFSCIFFVLLVYMCVKAKYNYDESMKNGQDSFLTTFRITVNETFTSIKEVTKIRRARFVIHFGAYFPTTLKHIRLFGTSGRSASNIMVSSNGGIYTAANTNSDRINLAENQEFDDGIFANDAIYQPTRNQGQVFVDDVDDTSENSKNPYRSLTVKS